MIKKIFKMPTDRILGLDLLRSLIMLLSVPYHTALIFGSWVYSSPYHQEHNLISYGAQFSHLFRMELFFCLAGFFSILVIKKKGVEYFIKSRIIKLIIPFFLIYILFCFIFSMIDDYKVYSLYSAFFGHFWFIYTLLLLIVFTLILDKLDLLSKVNFKVFLLTFLLSFLSIFIKKDLTSIFYAFIIYLPSYFLGIFLFSYKNNIKIKYFISLIIISVFLISLKFLLKINQNEIDTNNISLIINEIINLIISYPLIILAFFIFRNLKNLKNNKFLKLMTESSLYIYLFHHPLVPFFAYIFDSEGINSYLLFFMTCGATFVVCFLIFFFIERNNTLRNLFAIRKI